MADDTSLAESSAGGSIHLFGTGNPTKPADGSQTKPDDPNAALKAQQDLLLNIKNRNKKKWYQVNPISKVKEMYYRKELLNQGNMLRREETMKQDLERYLMELEEKHAWIAYELNIRNYKRMVKEEVVNKAQKSELKLIEAQKTEDQLETGLNFFRGNVKGYRRWQSSPAKHLDITGHAAAVYSCKLSSDLKYILSCSADKTAKLWLAKSGSLVKTFYGHTKKVLDCDFHKAFNETTKSPVIVTCSGDGTIKLWNCVNEKCNLVN
jgi:WD40 repeat protein